MTDALWTELSLLVRPEAVEAVAELLQELTGNGVSIEPAIQALGPDEGYVLDESATQTLHAYVYGPVAATRRRAVRAQLRRAGLVGAVEGSLRWRTLRDEDWAEAWKAHYDIERVGRIVVRPAWREYAARPGEVVVSLDPGMAFGTGQHATTRMCLAELQAASSKQQGAGLGSVLDLGCGSGILAIAAVALAARSVVAVDTEEQAVAAARSNAALNGAEARIEVRQGSIDAAEDAAPFDLVLANINAATIIALAPQLTGALRPGGVIVAGGVIAEREAACAEALAAAGLRVERTLAEGDWRTLVARKTEQGLSF